MPVEETGLQDALLSTNGNAALDWRGPFCAEVARALGSGQPNRVESLYRDALRMRHAHAAVLQLSVLSVCARLGNRRAALPWLGRLVQRPQALRSEELAHAIMIAVEMGQAEAVLCLCRSLEAINPDSNSACRLDASQRVLALAKRMRLPHGRNGAWSMHLRLLVAVRETLEPALPHLPEPYRCQAYRVLDALQHMQPMSRRH